MKIFCFLKKQKKQKKNKQAWASGSQKEKQS